MTSVDRKYKFSGHQTFAFRYGWLEKGVRGVAESPDLFARDEAMMLLGVGKNMVESIRHWCQVTQLVQPAPGPGRDTASNLQATKLGRHLLGERGWDPYLEDDASLWLIHWLLVTNPTTATTWQLTFSLYNRPDFSRRELIAFVLDFASRRAIKVAESVVARDIDCLLRTYVPSAAAKKRAVVEDSFDCPLQQLRLIQPSLDGELYRFAIGFKPSLPPAVFAFALHEQFERRQARTESMSIQECLYAEGSPGQAFKLDEDSLIGYVEDLEDELGGSIVLDETAGLKQIFRREVYDPLKVLHHHYRDGKRR